MADQNTVVLTLKLYDEMTAKLNAAANQHAESLNKSKGAFSSLGDEIKTSFTSAIKGAVLAYASFEVVNKITGFMKDARLEYKEAVKVQSQLRSALGFTSDALNEQATALGKKLVVDNDEITAVQVQLANYIKSEEQIKKLTPAVLDLAAATGMDMVSAAKMVARGVADDSEELGRFKISVEGAKGSAERVDSVLQGINRTMGDQSVAVAQAKDIWDKIGLSVKNFKEELWGRLVGPTVIQQQEQNIKEYEQALKDGYRTIVAENETINVELTAQQRAFYEEEINRFKTAQNTKKYIAAQGGAGFVGPMGDTKAAAEERQKAAEEAAKKLKELQEKQLADSLAAYEMARGSEIALMEDGIAKEFALLDMKYEIEQQKYAENKIMLAAIEQQYNNNAQKLIDEDNKRIDEKKREQAALESTILINNLNDQLDADEQKMLSESGLIEQKRKFTEEEKELAARSVANTLGAAAAIFAGQKKYIALYKTLAIGQAIIDTYASANAAFRRALEIPIVGPALAPVAAGVAIATGMANVAKISQQKFETGTAYAPGGMALVGERGPEYVSLPAGSRVYNNSQTRNMTTNAALNVQIMDSSGNITETIRAQLRSGQADQLVRDIQAKIAQRI